MSGRSPEPRTRRGRYIIALLVVAALGGAMALLSHRRPEVPAPSGAPTFVGGKTCAPCHAEETRLWTGSHHDRAMEVASEQSVVGDFNGASFTYDGVTSRFYRRDGKFLVYTDGPDGEMGEYEVAYTFGVAPLQQYLIAMPGGRYQALGVAWDARPAAAGGQRWFHLYPTEHVTHDDVLHWTRPSQNWNDRCARCHSTNLVKGYRLDTDRYETTWSDVDVSCEACHGPGSAHVAWAHGDRRQDAERKGLVVALRDPEPAAWIFDGPSGIAHRSRPRVSHAEVETCAPCHARRAELSDGAPAGRPLLDDYRPALLEEGLYFADGQMEDEVYEYGSFLQSAMYHAGVTCSDCHDPHSLKLRADGNALCTRCHLASRFDTPEHHFHPAGSPGARCVACHMPPRTYMVIDERRDHGFRVPRPDLSITLGTPNTCTGCHADQGAEWARDVIAGRPGSHRLGTPHYGEAIAAGRKQAPDADARLSALAGDASAPAIARAAGVSLLRTSASPLAQATLERVAADGDPLLRLAAVEAAEGRDPAAVAALAAPRLDDPLRAIRLAAGQALAGTSGQTLPPERQAALARALDEYRAAQRANADRPESHVNLAGLEMKLGHPAEAERELDTAIRLAPYFVPAQVNLADLYRATGRDADGEQVLRRAIATAPENADAHHALGLLLVRQKRLGDALAELEQAARLAPENARYAYVLGVALHSTGQTARALEVLRAAHERRPGDRDLLVALATISRDSGMQDAAQQYAAALVAIAPWDPDARRLQQEMRNP